jgi:hypothetical protein
MRDSVKQAWSEAVGGVEGNIPHLYLDTKDLVTCAKGNLVDSDAPGDHSDLALGLPWRRPADAELATDNEVRADWHRVKAMQPGMRAEHYRSADALYLTAEDVEAFVQKRLGDFWSGLVHMFPDAEAYPAPVQLELLLMGWALGLGRLRRLYPHFCAAIVAQDWARAAAECEMKGSRPERNDLHKQLLLAAAGGGDPDDLPVNLPGMEAA